MSNREKTIQTATKLFHKQGFRDTSVDQILEGSGISKSNFYYHFEGKEALGFAVLDRLVEGFNTTIKDEVFKDVEVSPQDRIEKLFGIFIDITENRKGRYGCPFGNMALELSDVHEGFRVKLSQFFDEWAEALEACLEEGKTEGIWSDDLESRVMADFIIVSLEGAFLLTKTHRRPVLLHETMEMVMRLLRGYKV